MPQKKLPHVDKGLLDYLATCFPDRCPLPDMTDREIWMEVGAQKVMKKLTALHNNPDTDPGIATINA